MNEIYFEPMQAEEYARFKQSIREDGMWDAAHFAYNLSEILGELVATTGDELEAPAGLIDLLADCSAVLGNLSTQLKSRTVKAA